MRPDTTGLGYRSEYPEGKKRGEAIDTESKVTEEFKNPPQYTCAYTPKFFEPDWDVAHGKTLEYIARCINEARGSPLTSRESGMFANEVEAREWSMRRRIA